MLPQWILLLLSGVAAGALLTLAWQRYSRSSANGVHSEVSASTTHTPDTERLYRLKSIAVLVFSLAVLTIAIGYGSSRSVPPLAGPQSLAPNIAGPAEPSVADVDTMIERLEARLERNPEDGEGFRMLGWAYLMTDRPADAVIPYRKAVALLPSDAGAHTGYGEALTAMNAGMVSDEALGHFKQAREINQSDVRARYFIAKSDYQNGRKRQALDEWIALANETPADAAWQSELSVDIAKAASELDVDVSDRLVRTAWTEANSAMPILDQGTIDAAASLSQQEQEAMVDRMVDGLAARLAKSPNDPGGWSRLIRSRMVRGEYDQAAQDLATARRALARDSAGLVRVNATASELGVR